MLMLLTWTALAHDPLQGQFDSIDEFLPTPNRLRTSSGRPGPDYWQQQADYVIEVTIDDENQRVIGTERITYHNNSIEELPYLWLQLDQNYLATASERDLMRTAPHMSTLYFSQMKRVDLRPDYDGRMQITRVESTDSTPLNHLIDNTLMRIDLPTPLQPQDRVSFEIDWEYNINDASVLWARTGYEYFEEDDNYLYEIAQFYPRMAVYTDVSGWLTKEYLGSGEFATEFGDFDVRITVPSDHVVAATGELQNAAEVLSKKQMARYEESKTAPKPMFVITPEEAQRNQNTKKKEQQTWHFTAANVRDFAFASSRKFIWDSWGREIDGQTVMAMSFYPNEAEPLWSTYSTHAVAHTLDVYSRLVFPYPYPVAISVNGPIGGMEYPMICFNGPRPLEDGTYADETGPWRHGKYALISVIIHEVGHNWFPMIINTDERSWTWMDEGLNSYVQLLAEMEWEEDYPVRRGEPQHMVRYMTSDHSVPIMTDADSLLQKGNNAYGKPATALNILRETVVGAESFDFAFQYYAQSWAFKRPMPADFFRSIEDASGKDLDWFWRGWFYTTNHVDLGIESVTTNYKNTADPNIDKPNKRALEARNDVETKTELRYAGQEKYVDTYPELLDFYNTYDPLDVTYFDNLAYDELTGRLSDEEWALLEKQAYYTTITIANKTQMPMPVPLRIYFANETTQDIQIPAHVWRRNPKKFTKLIISKQPVVKVQLDPHLEIADANRDDNVFPQRIKESYFDVIESPPPASNPMQDAKKVEERDQDSDD